MANETIAPLRIWMEDEARRVATLPVGAPDARAWREQVALLERTTVAFGIVELLRRGALAASSSDATRECRLDNFAVRLSSGPRMAGSGGHPSWSRVRGVCMLSRGMSARITEPSFLSGIFDSHTNEELSRGRCLEAAITSQLPDATNRPVDQMATNNSDDCRSFGLLLYELYSGTSPLPTLFPEEAIPRDANGASADLPTLPTLSTDHCMANNDPPGTSPPDGEEPRKKREKRSIVRYDKKKGKAYAARPRQPYATLRELGCPASVSGLVRNLMEGHGTYATLEAVSDDLRLLLRDPARFLFDRLDAAPRDGRVPLSFRDGQLYGRENEVTLITDAFCRVSGGTNEAIFIGGYSGSGKTALVRSLTARVDVAGGYVLTEKVDQMHRERPTSGVLSAFNNLCFLIRQKSSPSELDDIARRLQQDFAADFCVLVKLLPRIDVISSQLTPAVAGKGGGNQMSFHNICFVLQRFLRVVSSVHRPVVFFLDDVQWCSATSLELIRALLSARGSTFFFVGNFRDNEVGQNHPIFGMMSTLKAGGVPVTRLTLHGLRAADLNTMMSDATGMLPRTCKSLSDTVFQKTKGNPFFVLEFLKSLVESRLLKYSLRDKTWIWDDNEIRSEDITDNVLYLLSKKMTSLPEKMQEALKVLSCFGIRVEGAIVGYLNLIPEYSNFREMLDQLISEGCIRQLGTSGFMFVHDKVRESAYSFIPECGKNEFHYNLGVSLYSVASGCNMNDAAIFSIVDQINLGVPNLVEEKLSEDILNLNVEAGSRAMKCSDYVMANSYFKSALILLPEDRWVCSYECCLMIFFLRAKAAYSCGDIETAFDSLKEILDQGDCLNDKLDAYYLYIMILTAQGKKEGWATCCLVLSKLNETIPSSVDLLAIGTMVKQIGETLSKISDDDLLNMQEITSALPTKVLKIYQFMLFIAYQEKPEMIAFIACRIIKLTLDHGLCEDSVFGFAQYAAVVCNQSKEFQSIREACRIGQASIRLLEKFGSSVDSNPTVCLMYFGFVAPFVEPIQQCTDNLRKSFEVDMSSGDMLIAFYSSVLVTKLAIFGGENLQALLKEVDYHVGAMSRLHNKNLLPYLLQYRETISILIDKGNHTASRSDITDLCEGVSACAVDVQRWKEGMYLNRMLQAFWSGHAQRCQHWTSKTIELQSTGQYTNMMVLFYSSINSFRGMKNKNGNGTRFLNTKHTYYKAISLLKPAAELSPWNVQSKVYLLEALMFSFENRNFEARASYAASIASSCASRFAHEQGLACELAGLHHKKVGEADMALGFYQQAKECYQRWGSQMKVESISQEMENLVSATI